MTRRLLSLLLVMAVPLMGAEMSPAEQVRPLVEGLDTFTFAFYKEAAKTPGNLVISPFNIATALSMTYLGARGETAAQMEKVLGFGKDTPEELAGEFHKLLGLLQGSGQGEEFRLDMANSVWLQQGMPILFLFKSLLKRNYRTEPALVNFAQPALAVKQINQWVVDNTGGYITDLLQDDSVDAHTKLVLVSAIYLKAHWMRPFEKGRTEELPFHVSKNETTPTPMMNQTGRFPFMRGEGFSALALPYQGQEEGPRLAMLVMLPDAIGGLGDLEDQLSLDLFEQVLSALAVRSVAVSFPKFRLANRVYARSLLESLGLKAPFTMAADFSGISGRPDLMIDGVIHQAYIEVDEAGTEAAAATAVSVGVKSLTPDSPDIVFTADHPFVYTIMDTDTGQILFIGRVTTP